MSSHTLPTGASRHWGSDGEDYHFQYDLAKGETLVVDSLGREERYYWGTLYADYRHSDLLAGQLRKTTAPQGVEWHYVYDDIGRLIETRDPLGHSEYILYTEHWALPLSITGRDGHTGTRCSPTPAPEPRNTYEEGPAPRESDAPIRHRFRCGGTFAA